MPFEYAASFPRDAESALKAKKDSMKRCFSIFHDQKSREKINEGVSIVSFPSRDGYDWEIVISQDLKQMMENKSQSIMNGLGRELIEKFEAFVSLESDILGHSIEWSPVFNSEGEEIIEMWDEQKGKAIAIITETKEFKKWIQFRCWASQS